ncbi:hypothetical protein GCM10011322_19100 [Salinarimonas ramus]|uniref:Uncharacterized protein n=1 Tax=Salinarimonas ramus TaxID=690164 RepID=A0A917Q7C3_9HYPH|nr:hypothetical protein [Salinarimonas ramus]GGK32576.1 hypothetical protein GCM10011322_19100 [Salinarimonas ramus]
MRAKAGSRCPKKSALGRVADHAARPDVARVLTGLGFEDRIVVGLGEARHRVGTGGDDLEKALEALRTRDANGHADHGDGLVLPRSAAPRVGAGPLARRAARRRHPLDPLDRRDVGLDPCEEPVDRGVAEQVGDARANPGTASEGGYHVIGLERRQAESEQVGAPLDLGGPENLAQQIEEALPGRGAGGSVDISDGRSRVDRGESRSIDLAVGG